MQCGGLLCNAMQSIINTKMCEYKSLFGWECKEEALPNSKYCILHVDLPEDEESEEFKRINGLKEEIVKEKVDNGDFNFEGAKLLEIDFSTMVIEGNVNFNDVVIIKDATFEGAKIGGDARFVKAKIGGDARFKAKIDESALFFGVVFSRAKIGGNVLFREAEIQEHALFNGAVICRDVLFSGTAIRGYALFNGAEIGRNVFF